MPMFRELDIKKYKSTREISHESKYGLQYNYNNTIYLRCVFCGKHATIRKNNSQISICCMHCNTIHSMDIDTGMNYLKRKIGERQTNLKIEMNDNHKRIILMTGHRLIENYTEYNKSLDLTKNPIIKKENGFRIHISLSAYLNLCYEILGQYKFKDVESVLQHFYETRISDMNKLKKNEYEIFNLINKEIFENNNLDLDSIIKMLFNSLDNVYAIRIKDYIMNMYQDAKSKYIKNSTRGY